MVATIVINEPSKINHFGTITRESGPVNVIANAERLKGTLNRMFSIIHTNSKDESSSLMLDSKDGGPAKDILPISRQVQVECCPPEVWQKRYKE